ncbi:MFS transporter [Peribacillus simplex]|uniref:staphylopine family metallophore export MFS transporter CntE n=1 Tax=Peribacillus simplex TaxID=1478 RepID=UPI003267B2F9
MKYTPLSFQMIQVYILSMLFFTASSVLTVIFPLQASTSGMLEGEIGIIMGVYMLVCMILRPWAGQMVAKYSVFTIMKWLLIGHVATLFIYISFGIDSLYVVRVLQGVVTAFFSMAIQMGISETLREEERGQGMSMYSLSSVMPNLYGPALALLLWSQADKIYLQLFIVALAIFPLFIFIRSPLPKTKQPNASFTLFEIMSALKEARHHKGLIISSITMLVGACIFGAISTFLPLYMVNENVGNAVLYLFLQSIVVVGSRFILRKRIPSDGKWHPKFIVLVLLSSFVGTTILAGGFMIGPFIYVAALFNGLSSAMLYPSLTTYISFVVPTKSKHILLGVFLASYDLGFSLGSLVMGFIVQFGSFSIMYATCSVLALFVMGIIAFQRTQKNNPKSFEQQLFYKQ